MRKVFGGTVALVDANLSVAGGEIHGLLGENGAGKSTLIKVLAGVVAPDRGSITIGGFTSTGVANPEAARGLGMAFIHQDLGLVADQSVAENIAMGTGYPKHGPVIDWKEVRRRARVELAAMGVEIDVSALVGELPLAARSAVAIARALGSDARLLVLDEPTASLAAGEVASLFHVLRNLRGAGLGIVFVSHRMDEVRALCDRVTVLRDGRTVGAGNLSEIDDAAIVRMIVGRDLAFEGRSADAAPDVRRSRLAADGLRGATLGPLSFAVGAGEVLGLCGLSDCGAHEFGPIAFGVRRPAAGSMMLDDVAYAPRSVGDALGADVAYVPEDRAGAGLAAELTLRENLWPNPVGRWWNVLRRRGERLRAAQVLRDFDVRPPDPERQAATLSGGNAQKLLLAKWLQSSPRVVVLNEPTTGVDINAREAIHGLIRRQARLGATVVVASSDFEEVAAVCDRALVLRRGLVSRELAGDELTVDAITDAAMRAPTRPTVLGEPPPGGSA